MVYQFLSYLYMFKNLIIILIIIFLLSLKDNFGNTVDNTGGHVGSCSKRFDCKEICSDIYETKRDVRECKTLCNKNYQCR